MPAELLNNYDALWIRHTLWDTIGLDGIRVKAAGVGWPLWLLSLQVFSVLAFGGCHLMAWNYSFVTFTEAVLWRACGLACLALPLIWQTLIWFDDFSSMSRWISGVIYHFVAASMIFIRFYLMIEMIITLRSVPRSVYEDVNWQTYIPHL